MSLSQQIDNLELVRSLRLTLCESPDCSTLSNRQAQSETDLAVTQSMDICSTLGRTKCRALLRKNFVDSTMILVIFWTNNCIFAKVFLVLCREATRQGSLNLLFRNRPSFKRRQSDRQNSYNNKKTSKEKNKKQTEEHTDAFFIVISTLKALWTPPKFGSRTSSLNFESATARVSTEYDGLSGFYCSQSLCGLVMLADDHLLEHQAWFELDSSCCSQTIQLWNEAISKAISVNSVCVCVCVV